MDSEIKYPYIGEGDISGAVMLFTGIGEAITIDRGQSNHKDKETGLSECFFKNITHEYLSNTWGVVESKEHAEFIIELAELHGFELHNDFSVGVTHFVISNGEVVLTYCTPAIGEYHKKITIPLPPKTEVSAGDLTPEEEFELHQNQAVQALNSDYYEHNNVDGTIKINCRSKFVDIETWPNLGDPVTVYGQQGDVILPADKNGFYIINADGLYLAAKEKGITECEEIESEDTWPQVGDEVCWSNGHRKGELKCIHDGWAWVKVDEDDFASIKTDKLTKPKSKEDLLIEELQAKLCENNYVDNYTLANDIVNGMIEGLIYESK